MASLVQSIDYAAVGPPLVVAVTAVGALVTELFLPRARAVLGVAFAGLVAGFAALGALWGEVRRTFCLRGDACSYVVDELTLVFQLLALAGVGVVLLLSVPSLGGRPGTPGGPGGRPEAPPGEYAFLLLASAAGAMTLAAARDLVTLVVALEMLSLPAFALVGLRRHGRSGPADLTAGEAALKFFLVSVVSTAVMLMGISLVYGLTGALQLSLVAEGLSRPPAAAVAGATPALAVGVALTLAGFAFKVSAVPFHFWAPDTYEGAPVPVAAYLSVVSKAAGFAGLLLVVGIGFRPYVDVWAPLVAVLAALTMTVGNLVALRQRHAVRLLAWSSIAQAGYMLVPLGVAAEAPEVGQALSATVAYVLIYGVMNLGAFAAVVVASSRLPGNTLADYRGLARSQPVTALALAFFLVCLAGLPPGLIGLFAKVVVFRAAVSGGIGWLAVVMAVNIVIALYYYLVWAASLFAPPAGEGAPVAAAPSGRSALPAALALALLVVAAVVLSALPQILLQVLPGQAALLG
ncbi:MAG: NADH-quinone oxidoreductase subunit N [Streptomycetales bacterium]